MQYNFYIDWPQFIQKWFERNYLGKRERKMKKTICIVLSLLLALSLAGCGLFAGGSEKSQKKADVISLLDGEKSYTAPEGVDYDIYYVGQFDVNLDDEYGVLTEF